MVYGRLASLLHQHTAAARAIARTLLERRYEVGARGAEEGDFLFNC